LGWRACNRGPLPLPPLQESFWLENSERMVDNNCQLLRVLMKLIETSRDTTTLAVACHDLAQFVTCYPHGALQPC
jgi:V-type H+-transporting ATPase subunit H